MKNTHLLLIFLLSALFQISLTAQPYKANPLIGTYWNSIHPRSDISLILHFTEDSIFVADHLDKSFGWTKKYQVRSDTFFVQSFNGFCDSSLVGIYRYEIVDSALTFSVIDDPCEKRISSTVDDKYIRVDYRPPVNVDENGNVYEVEIVEEAKAATDANPKTFYKIYFYPNPNPTNEFLHASETHEIPRFHLYNRFGTFIKRGNNLIRKSGYNWIKESGIYFLTVKGFHLDQTYKLMAVDLVPNTLQESLEGSPTFEIYPNPSTDGIFKFKDTAPHSYYFLYDENQNFLKVGEINWSWGEIDTREYEGDLFYVSVFKQFKKTKTFKLIRTADLSTSLEDITQEGSKLNIYPNPSADGIFNYEYSGEDTYYLLYDSSGKYLHKGDLTANGRIDVSFFESDFFFITVFEDNIPKTYQLTRAN